MAEARKFAKANPDRFEVGKAGWVTARFTDEEPLAESVWKKWLAESFAISRDNPSMPKSAAKKKTSKGSHQAKKSRKKKA